MAFRISGFGADTREKKEMVSTYQEDRKTIVPRQSLVQIRFPGKGMALTYFNDLFDLKVGDRVYVDGKLEGQLGHVVDVSYNFKIKISEELSDRFPEENAFIVDLSWAKSVLDI